jgi:hypothetical protein
MPNGHRAVESHPSAQKALLDGHPASYPLKGCELRSPDSRGRLSPPGPCLIQRVVEGPRREIFLTGKHAPSSPQPWRRTRKAGPPRLGRHGRGRPRCIWRRLFPWHRFRGGSIEEFKDAYDLFRGGAEGKAAADGGFFGEMKSVAGGGGVLRLVGRSAVAKTG